MTCSEVSGGRGEISLRLGTPFSDCSPCALSSSPRGCANAVPRGKHMNLPAPTAPVYTACFFFSLLRSRGLWAALKPLPICVAAAVSRALWSFLFYFLITSLLHVCLHVTSQFFFFFERTYFNREVQNMWVRENCSFLFPKNGCSNYCSTLFCRSFTVLLVPLGGTQI